jgi:hypothetical protein
VLADDEKSEQTKTLDIVRLGSGVVLELPLSDTFVWPFRFTAVAAKEAGVWKLHQMRLWVSLAICRVFRRLYK